jgi:ABC-2 type transport system ATP-binding protein
MALIEIKDLNKKYGPGAQPVLNHLSLNLEAGRIIGLLGPNGCGKSTLLKILAGLIADYQGDVRIDGHQPDVKTYLSGWMRPVDALDFFADFYADFDRTRAETMLQQFHLDPRQPIHEMSKGMQEKLQLILVMSRRAKIYLLDEPMGGVDPATRSAILDIVLRNYQEDALMVLATHLIQDVERIFDQAILLGFGELILFDEVDVIRQKYGKSVDEVFREVFKCSAN